jgi:hypothetical protein
VVTAAVGDAIRSKIGKPKRKRRSSDRREKDYRTADQQIGGRTLGRVTRPPAEIMEIDLPGGDAVRKRGAAANGRWWLGFGPI